MPLLDKLRKLYGVGPVCSELHIAPSTYYHCQQQRHHSDKRSARAQRDDWLKRGIQRVYDENHQVYGVRKVWRQLLREGIRVARCTVARLMAVMGLAGVLRGKKVRTTVSRKASAADDRVKCVRRIHRGMAGLIVYGNDIRAGCTGAGIMVPSPVRHSPSQ